VTHRARGGGSREAGARRARAWREVLGLEPSDTPGRLRHEEAAAVLGIAPADVARHAGDLQGRLQRRPDGDGTVSLRATLAAAHAPPAWLHRALGREPEEDLPRRLRGRAHVSRSTAAAVLGVPPAQFRRLVGAGMLPLHGRNRIPVDALVALRAAHPPLLHDLQMQLPDTAFEAMARGRGEAEPAPRRIEVRLPERRHAPDTVVFHLGPTNSGKTHDALAFLAAEGAGTFAAPLRMLAQEAHERLCALAGPENVGLVTGEERINENAPIIACTAEMAPMRGQVLVLDECHWAADPERGSAWSRLLAAADYRHLRLLGALDALPLLRAAFPDGELRVHERLAPLEWAGPVDLGAVPPRSVVITFSRRAVLALAAELERHRRGRVAVLYGAMPLAARRVQIRRFIEGEAQVMVATDVLGHGVNLPCDTVVFAETSKYDGRERRPLHDWEVAQIAGRAGRHGLSERGRVAVLRGVGWLQPSASIRHQLAPRTPIEDWFGFRAIEHGLLRPRLEDLGVERPGQLMRALSAWSAAAAEACRRHEWLRVESVAPLQARIALLDAVMDRLGLDAAWRLATAPADADGDAELLVRLGHAVAHDESLADLVDVRRIRGMELEEAEAAARRAAILRWFCHAFPGRGEVALDRAVTAEAAAAERVSELLGAAIRASRPRCPECGGSRAPWFPLCDRCHASRQGRPAHRHEDVVAP